MAKAVTAKSEMSRHAAVTLELISCYTRLPAQPVVRLTRAVYAELMQPYGGEAERA